MNCSFSATVSLRVSYQELLLKRTTTVRLVGDGQNLRFRSVGDGQKSEVDHEVDIRFVGDTQKSEVDIEVDLRFVGDGQKLGP